MVWCDLIFENAPHILFMKMVCGGHYGKHTTVKSCSVRHGAVQSKGFSMPESHDLHGFWLYHEHVKKDIHLQLRTSSLGFHGYVD